jgi:hypothetical protein
MSAIEENGEIAVDSKGFDERILKHIYGGPVRLQGGTLAMIDSIPPIQDMTLTPSDATVSRHSSNVFVHHAHAVRPSQGSESYVPALIKRCGAGEKDVML